MRKLLLASTVLLMACSAQAQKSDFGPPSEVQDIYSVAVEPSPERIRADIQTLVAFGTRHTLSERLAALARRGGGYLPNLRKFQKSVGDVSKLFMSQIL